MFEGGHFVARAAALRDGRGAPPGNHGDLDAAREQLLDAVAGRSYEVFDRSIDVHISSLRRKLGDTPRSPKFIRTVRSAGYMFQAPGSQPPQHAAALLREHQVNR